MMTQHEYDFLTGSWTGPKGAAYNQVYEFCKEFGWMRGFYKNGTPELTHKGMDAVKAYQAKNVYLFAFTDMEKLWLAPFNEVGPLTSVCLLSSNPSYKPQTKYEASKWLQ